MTTLRCTPEGLLINPDADAAPALIQAGALHYLRLPHPSLWRPVLERMRMGGLNAVLLPIPWAYHAPAPGFYDFTGPRDLDRLFDEVERAGLWLIPHIGPSIGAGLDAGGVPAWVLRLFDGGAPCSSVQAGASDFDVGPVTGEDTISPNPAFLRQLESWWIQLFAHIRGRDNLLCLMLDPGQCADAVETPHTPVAYIPALYEILRRLDSQTPCAIPYAPGPRLPNSLSFVTLNADEVGAESIFKNGTAPFVVLNLDVQPVWAGSRPMKVEQVLGIAHPRDLLAAMVAAGANMVALSPYHAGITWGWWAEAQAPSSYGYGAPVTESGGLSVQYYKARRLALTLETMGDVFRGAAPASEITAVPPELLLGAGSSAAGSVAFLKGASHRETFVHLALDRRDMQVAVEDVPLIPDSVRVLPLNWRLTATRLLGSTLEPVLRTEVAGRELLILLNEGGGEVTLPGECRPRHSRGPVFVERGVSSLSVHFDPARLSSILLDTPDGILQILALEPALANRVWPLDDVWRTTRVPPSAWQPPDEEPAVGIVLGPDFVVPEVTDPKGSGGFRFLAAAKGFGYRWGPWRGSDPHTWLAPIVWPAPPRISLPPLNWTSRAGAPEVLPAYDDRGWRHVAALDQEGGLTMEAQGVDYGFIWYRGHFSGLVSAVTLTCHHACDVFLNGEHVATLNPPPHLGPMAPKTLPLSPRYLRENNVLAVLVEAQGRAPAWNRAMAPHGLLSCTVRPQIAAGTRLDVEEPGPLPEKDRSVPVTWRARGGLSGETLVQGFYGFVDGRFLPDDGAHHVTWHQANFNLNLPPEVEVPIFLYLDRTPNKAYIYLNGQLIGRLAYPQGDQRQVWLPDGLLRRRGTNELLIAQWTRGAAPGIGDARLLTGTVQAWHTEGRVG